MSFYVIGAAAVVTSLSLCDIFSLSLFVLPLSFLPSSLSLSLFPPPPSLPISPSLSLPLSSQATQFANSGYVLPHWSDEHRPWQHWECSSVFWEGSGRSAWDNEGSWISLRQLHWPKEERDSKGTMKRHFYVQILFIIKIEKQYMSNYELLENNNNIVVRECIKKVATIATEILRGSMSCP